MDGQRTGRDEDVPQRLFDDSPEVHANGAHGKVFGGGMAAFFYAGQRMAWPIHPLRKYKMTQESNNLAADLWALADLLRGDFKQSQYGRVILPFALLRRLECVLESSKSAVLLEAAKVEKMAIAEEAKEKLLLRATRGLSFFNTSPMDLSTLGESGIKANLERYIQCFSKDAREIFDHFKFAEFIGLLSSNNWPST